MVAILFFVAVYLVREWPHVASGLAQLGWVLLAGSFLLILAAKFVLSFVAQESCRRFGIDVSFADGFHLYNFTQIAKYIPGAIWQFVGRAALLKSWGIDNRRIGNAMVYEVFWVVASAGLIGVALVGMNAGSLAAGIAALLPAPLLAPLNVAAMVVGVAVVVVACGWIVHKRVRNALNLTAFLPTPRLAVALLVSWLALGLSLWVLSPPFGTAELPVVYTIGVYCLGYMIGFLAPFAPAGLGVREAVFTIGMSPYLPVADAILLASINRIVYVAVEILVFLVSPLVLRRFGKASRPQS